MAGSIYLPILSSFNASGVNNAKQALGGLSGAFDGVKRALGLASASFVAFRAVSETIDFGRSSIVAARDLERNLNALDSVFGSLSPQMEQFAKEGTNIGLSQIDAAKASTFLGSVLKQAGFSMEDVASQTQSLVGLASDLAVTYGYDVSEALSGMTALFRGEYDPIEKFGVAMKQSEVNAVLAANGQDKLTGAARRNAEQMARLALLYQRTQDAQGAYKEGAGTLFVEQQRLQAIFNNLQAEIGKTLIPALVKVAEALQPLVTALAPVLNQLFEQFAGIITILSGELSNVQSNLYNFVSVLSGLFGILKAILPFILDNALALGTFAAVFVTLRGAIGLVAGALAAYQTATTAAAVANGTFAASFALTPWGAVAVSVAAIAGGLVLLAQGLNKAQQENKTFNDEFDRTVQTAKNDPFKQLAISSYGYGLGLVGIIDKQKQVAQGVDWKALGANPKNVPSASRLAGQRSPSSGGLDSATSDFQKTLDDLLKNFKGAAAVDKAAESAAKKAAAKLKAQKEALKEFKKDLKSLTEAVMPLPQITREIGQFEQSTVDAFDALNKKVQQGIIDGKIAKKGGQALLEYVATERKALEAINRQRDEIVKKRTLAETLISDIKSAITGVGSLAGLLESQAISVTETTSKLINGITVTTRRTVEQVTGTGGVLNKLKDVVTKTKAFAKQLTDLKALGLNANLFKQIVEAGPDVGGALATEILAGGAESVKSLNTTFTELETVAGTIAEQTAVVMYNSGVEVAGGLVNGLLSQEAAIIAAAEKLAAAFNAAYQSQISGLTIPEAPTVATTPKVAPKTTTKTTTINNKITVKASPTNTKATGAAMISAINKYKAASGIKGNVNVGLF